MRGFHNKTLRLRQVFVNIGRYHKYKNYGKAVLCALFWESACAPGRRRTIIIMKKPLKLLSRGFAALMIAALMLSFALGATPPVEVSNAEELVAALNDAAGESGSVLITYASGVSSITLSTSVSIPSNVVLSISDAGDSLCITGGTVNVYGNIYGGTIAVSGNTVSSGTLVRHSGSTVTGTLTASGSGAIRGAYTLSLENLAAGSTESIVSITYDGESGADTSSFVTGAVTDTIYPEMTSNGSAFKTITSVTTNAGNVFRLGTGNSDTLSLAYLIVYGEMTGATLSAANPTNYTSSDAAITLNNPTKEGYIFDGWTCAQLGITDPTQSAVIPEGMSGALTFIANWSEDPLAAGGKTGGSGGGSSSGSSTATTDTTETDETTSDETAVVQETETSTSSVRVGKGSSSTKVTFTSDVDAVIPTVVTAQENSFPWGWTLLGVGGTAVLVYIAALINRKVRERAKMK